MTEHRTLNIERGTLKWKITAAVLCAVLIALPAMAADITGGYTFVSGELVTHTKLNTGSAGTINTSFYSGKSSAGSNPNTAWQILLRDTTSDLYKRSTLAEAIFDHTSFLSARTALTAPEAGDTVLVYDVSALTYKQVAFSNLFVGAANFASVLTNEDRFVIFDYSAGTVHGLTFSNMLGTLTAGDTNIGTEVVMVLDASRRMRRLTTAQLITKARDYDTVVGLDRLQVYDNGAADLMNVPVFALLAGSGVTNTAATNQTIPMVDPANSNIVQMTYVNLRSNVNWAPGYIMAREEQTSGTDAGTFATAMWTNRVLNTLYTQNVDGVSLSANLVTLPAGYYNFRAIAPGHAVGIHQLMLTNSTDGAVVMLGSISRAGTGNSTYGEVSGRFTNASAKAYGLRHRCTTTVATTGLGVSAGWGTEVYAQVEFWKD